MNSVMGFNAVGFFVNLKLALAPFSIETKFPTTPVTVAFPKFSEGFTGDDSHILIILRSCVGSKEQFLDFFPRDKRDCPLLDASLSRCYVNAKTDFLSQPKIYFLAFAP